MASAPEIPSAGLNPTLPVRPPGLGLNRISSCVWTIGTLARSVSHRATPMSRPTGVTVIRTLEATWVAPSEMLSVGSCVSARIEF